MTRDLFIKKMIPDSICMTPIGEVANHLTPEEFGKMYKIFLKSVLEIRNADIGEVSGYGEFNEDNQLEYRTCREFLIDTFSETYEDYWYNWKEMFQTTILSEEFFETYYEKMLQYADYCEEKRYLVNNNTFFINMITDKEKMVGFADWSRAGVTDFLLDFAIMDLNKPYLQIPELLYQYCKENEIEIENFHERYLCMAFYKGIDTLRWHASIDDLNACKSIMEYLENLEERVKSIS